MTPTIAFDCGFAKVWVEIYLDTQRPSNIIPKNYESSCMSLLLLHSLEI